MVLDCWCCAKSSYSCFLEISRTNGNPSRRTFPFRKYESTLIHARLCDKVQPNWYDTKFQFNSYLLLILPLCVQDTSGRCRFEKEVSNGSHKRMKNIQDGWSFDATRNRNPQINRNVSVFIRQGFDSRSINLRRKPKRNFLGSSKLFCSLIIVKPCRSQRKPNSSWFCFH